MLECMHAAGTLLHVALTLPSLQYLCLFLLDSVRVGLFWTKAHLGLGGHIPYSTMCCVCQVSAASRQCLKHACWADLGLRDGRLAPLVAWRSFIPQPLSRIRCASWWRGTGQSGCGSRRCETSMPCTPESPCSARWRTPTSARCSSKATSSSTGACLSPLGSYECTPTVWSGATSAMTTQTQDTKPIQPQPLLCSSRGACAALSRKPSALRLWKRPAAGSWSSAPEWGVCLR